MSLDLDVIQAAIDREDGCDLIDLAPPVVEELRQLRQQRRAVLTLAEDASRCYSGLAAPSVNARCILDALGVES